MTCNDDFICNVLIIGKTGTGKSSLLNYLCNKKVAETGAGLPVTGENIYEYSVNINNQEVRLFDSWGIEPGKTTRWNQLVANSQKKHGVQKSIEEWFHCVIYCIQAGGKIVSADSSIIRQFLKDGYHLTIILTKADQISKDEIEIMKKVILEEVPGVKIIATCAEQKKTRTYTVEPFGKEEAVAAIFDGWKKTIIDRMPKHVIGQLCELIDSWADSLKQTIQDDISGIKISGVKADNKPIYQVLAETAKDFIQIIQQEALPIVLKDSIDSCRKASVSLKNTFDISIDDTIFDKDILENAKNSILDYLKDFFKGFFIIPAIKDFFQSRSKKHINNQKKELC